jgi:glycosyltransferase involved in cell wall biosynthesis
MFKKKIGFFYINDPNWIGGIDYVINAVNALMYLDPKEQPEIDVIVSGEVNLDELADRIKYPKYNFYVISTDGKNIICKWLFNKLKWKFIYPFPKAKMYDKIFYGVSDKRKVYWIPDFQEEYFSHLFGGDVVEKRRKMRFALARQTKSVIVLSSQNAYNDLLKFYGPKIQAKTKVLNFANPSKWNFNDDFSTRTLNNFNLESNNYFICPNQIWEHKNHKVVFDALRLVLKTNPNLKIAFCGKECDPRNPGFVEELKNGSNDLVVSGNVFFLGFLPKDEQMCLIKESIALLQPSKFEGWSTTIEDGISLGKRVIASNLAVNIEQLGDKGCFFNPEDSGELANHLLSLAVGHYDIEYHQERRVKEFAKNLIRLID